MLKVFKNILILNYTNFKGWKTNRKIIVIESDDWGSIMMKDQRTYNQLLKKGIKVDSSMYSKLDCLENRKDLDDLFNVLIKHKSEKGYTPKFTFNTVLENPNFDKIRESNFDIYHGETFNDSYKKFHNEDNMKIWTEAIKENLMIPQFHAKEHLNRFFWMNDLKNNNKDTRIGFDHSFYGIGIKTSSQDRKHYLATYNSETSHEEKLIQENLIEGLNKFKNIFGFDSKTFIGSNYTWSRELETILNNEGVIGLQGQRIQHLPVKSGSELNTVRHYTGRKNKHRQIHTVRNTTFEPYSCQSKDWVDFAMKNIENAFKWKTPAIIVSHRINFVSSISSENKERNLILLDSLLKRIIKKYPDVEFLTSAELVTLINKKT